MYENNFKKFHSLFKKKISLPGSVDESENFIVTHPLAHEHLSWSISPWSDYYCSPLNHMNLFNVLKPSQLSSFKFVLVRDGLFTLVDFFNRFPDPALFSNLFIVHFSLREFIPEKWLKKILFFDYDLTPSTLASESARDRLIVKGLLKKGAFDLDKFKENLRNIIQYNQFEKVLICLPPRQNFFLDSEWNGDVSYVNEISEFMKFLHCELAPKVEFELIHWQDFFFISDLHLYRFYDANIKSSIYIDDHSSYFLLRRGALPLFFNKTIPENIDDLNVPITYMHNIRVYSRVPSFKSHFPEVQNILKILSIEKNEKLGPSAFEALYELSNKHVVALPF